MAELGLQTPAPIFPGSRWEKGSSNGPLTFTEGKVWGLTVPQGVCARREAVSLKDVGVFIRRLRWKAGCSRQPCPRPDPQSP